MWCLWGCRLIALDPREYFPSSAGHNHREPNQQCRTWPWLEWDGFVPSQAARWLRIVGERPSRGENAWSLQCGEGRLILALLAQRAATGYPVVLTLQIYDLSLSVQHYAPSQ